MGELKQAVLNICLLSTAVSVCLMICPENSLKKQVRCFISLICLISFIAPFRTIEIPDSLERIQQEHSDRSAQLTAEASIEKAIQSVLNQNHISCTEIKVSVHIDDSQRISITDVKVTCDDFQDTVKILRELLGEEVQLHVTEILG